MLNTRSAILAFRNGFCGLAILVQALGALVGNQAQAAGNPTTLLIPIHHIDLNGEFPRVSYDLPCGATTLGPLVRTNITRDTLSLAMVIRQSKIICTGLPTRVSEELTQVVTDGYLKVLPIPVPEAVRISVVPVQQLNLNGSRVEAGFDAACLKVAGTILRRDEVTGTIEVAMARLNDAAAQAAANGVRDGSCPTALTVAELPATAYGEGRRYRPYETTPVDLERSHYLRLAAVKPGSLVRGKNGLSLSFYRQCNEAPIGIVVDGQVVPRSKKVTYQTKREVKVGVLVARYYNLVCEDGQGIAQKVIEDRLISRDVELPLDAKVALIAPTRRPTALTLREPSQYAVISKTEGKGLVIDFQSGCNRQVGAVYSRDQSNNLAVAVVELQGDPFACRKSQQLSLVQPYGLKGHGATAVFPLKIRRSGESRMM